jgi:hypothetical protein
MGELSMSVEISDVDVHIHTCRMMYSLSLHLLLYALLVRSVINPSHITCSH